MSPLNCMWRLVALRPHRLLRGAEVVPLNVTCGSSLACRSRDLDAVKLSQKLVMPDS
jgi:hypothetical protein